MSRAHHNPRILHQFPDRLSSFGHWCGNGWPIPDELLLFYTCFYYRYLFYSLVNDWNGLAFVVALGAYSCERFEGGVLGAFGGNN